MELSKHSNTYEDSSVVGSAGRLPTMTGLCSRLTVSALLRPCLQKAAGQAVLFCFTYYVQHTRGPVADTLLLSTAFMRLRLAFQLACPVQVHVFHQAKQDT